MGEDRVERAFAALQEAPPSSWRDVRAIARRRRRTRTGIAAGTVVVAAVAAIVIVPRLGESGGETSTPPLAAGITTGARIGSAVELVSKTTPLSSADAAAVSSVASAEQDFTAALLKHVPAGSGNVSVSPASLGIALSMLQNGARGPTRDEVRSALAASGISSTDLNEGWAGLTAQWTGAAKSADIEFSSANSLWQQRGLPVRKEFLGALGRYYASGVWQVDFEQHMPDALSAVNEWTSQHTRGKITKLFDQLDPDTLLVLANAVYFHAQWQRQFDAAQTEPGAFHPTGGTPSSAQFMLSPDAVAAARTDSYAAAQLPYRGGRFAALTIMPTHASLSDFVARLDGAALRDIASHLTDRLPVKLPRFTTTSTTDLMPVLSALGIRQALTPQADFSAMSPTPMQVGQAIQRVYLKVGEKGTEAAAATGIGMVPTSAGPIFDGITFDHPFLFLVRDTKTGAVLFASAINSPDPAS